VNVLIVGGGLAGLTLATALTQRGIRCEILEREREWTTVGAGIALYPNGIRALGRLGLAPAVEAAGQPIDRVRTLTAAGEVISDFPGEVWEGVGRTVAIHRAELQRVLVEAAAGVPVRMGTTVDAITRRADRVAVACSDGTTGEFDVVVGADGIRSGVRARCFEDSPPRYVGQMYWRTAVAADVVETATMMFADNRFVAMLPLGRGTTYVAAQLFCPEPFSLPESDWVPTVRDRFADFASPVADALAHIVPDGLHFGPAEEIERDEWRAGRVVLVGDAAHACSPTLAQGGSLAFEDALVLAELLATVSDVDDGLTQFVARREPRARWVRERTRLHMQVLNDGAPQLPELLRTTFDELAREY
jgi:2-polyprenyl-6-methoxyphenol hydroxylase-like FAD-dependent oxidoreductase